MDSSEESAPTPDAKPPGLRVVPLGGLGEFGMNMMLLELPGSAIVIDCGMMFPDASVLGVDAVIPDMSYVREIREKIVAIFLTHGHEDHIGALPFLLETVSVPVYGMKLTLGFVEDKLEEFDMRSRADLREMEPRKPIEAGDFVVEPIVVTHSIVDAVGLAIRTPFGTVVHTGDFKLDPTPIDGLETDLRRFAAYGEEGVMLLLSDSTNAIVEGYSRSESVVGGTLDGVFSRAKGRIVITTFASHIHRIQQIIDCARKAGRKVFLVGRSLVDNVETAERLGWIHFPRDVRPGHNKPMDEPAARTVVITTGTQGEPSSALARIALDEHRGVQVEPGDLVIISARTIPGNERKINSVIDHLYRRGAEVIHDEMPGIHVSGHACREELKTMLQLVAPRFFMPVHGTLRHMVKHAQLAESVGIQRARISVITNGEVAEFDGETSRIVEERVAAGKVFIDGQSEEVATVVVRDRQHLAEDGFVIVVVALDMQSGRLAREPEIITRGLVHVDESPEVMALMRAQVNEVLSASGFEELHDPEIVQEKLRAALKRFFRKKLNRRPMILPVVWEM
ncbi:MAG: ribonuclease J [Thermoanaerobaculia bacterium]|jgi:ribonuclease J